MNLLKSAIQHELDSFYAEIQGHGIPRREITQSAFTQARRKLKHDAFVELNDVAVREFYAHAPIKRWRGYRLLAVDGSGLRLPNTEQIRSCFVPGADEVPQGRLVELYDVLNGIVIGAEFSATEIGEGFHAECLLSRAQAGDVVLYDRGFPSFYLMALHRQQEVDFCMRTPLGRFKQVDEFVRSGEASRWIELRPSAKARKDCLRNGLSVDPLRVRLIRVDLPDGEVEVLITSLSDEIESTEFGDLYFKRWGIEEAYKLQKCRGELENFTGKSVQSVYQDLYAKLLTINLAAMCAFAAEEPAQARTRHRRHRYQINLSRTLSKVKYRLVCAVLNVEERLGRLLDWIAEDVEAVRPGRKYERKSPGRKKPGFHPAYKRSA